MGLCILIVVRVVVGAMVVITTIYSSNYPYHYQHLQAPIPQFLNAPKRKIVMKLVQ